MKKITKKTIESLDNLYNLVELIIAYILLFSAIGLTFFSIYDVISEFLKHKDTVKIVVTLIHHLLLIMIILEILWTVIHYMKTKKLSVEAFIIIAIISSVRKILVISASQSVSDVKSTSLISSLTVESFAQGLIVLIMIIAIYILRKSRLFLKELDEE